MSKIAVTDVDGTLIYRNSVFNRTRFPIMLTYLAARDIHFAVCTGRSPVELSSVLSPFDGSITAICCDGACTKQNGKYIDGLPIDGGDLGTLVGICRENGYPLELHAADVTYAVARRFSPLVGLSSGKESKGRYVRLESFDAVSSLSENIFKATVYSPKEPTENLSSLRVSYHSSGITEYVNRASSKKNAVCKLLSNLSLSLSDLVFFGDGENDVELIQAAGRSFTTYCADKAVFPLASEHTRDVIGTIIRLCDTDEL